MVFSQKNCELSKVNPFSIFYLKCSGMSLKEYTNKSNQNHHLPEIKTREAERWR